MGCPGGDGLKRIKIIFINVLFVTATTLLLRTIGLVFQVYLSNKIGPEGMGAFSVNPVGLLSVCNSGRRRHTPCSHPPGGPKKKLAGETGPGAFQAVTVALRYGVGLGSLWEQFCY